MLGTLPDQRGGLHALAYPIMLGKDLYASLRMADELVRKCLEVLVCAPIKGPFGLVIRLDCGSVPVAVVSIETNSVEYMKKQLVKLCAEEAAEDGRHVLGEELDRLLMD